MVSSPSHPEISHSWDWTLLLSLVGYHTAYQYLVSVEDCWGAGEKQAAEGFRGSCSREGIWTSPQVSTVRFKPFHIQILSFVSLAAGKIQSGKQLLGINELVMLSVLLEGCCAASFFFIKTSWPTVAVVSNPMIKAGFKSPARTERLALPHCLLSTESTCGSAANSTRAARWGLFPSAAFAP